MSGDLESVVAAEAQASKVDATALQAEVERELIQRAARRVADKVEKSRRPKVRVTF